MTYVSVGIVGSRRRNEQHRILDMVETLNNQAIKHGYEGIQIISGGAKGIDTSAKIVANLLDIPLIEFLPNKSEWHTKGIQIYYERNKQIAEASDILLAFPLNRKGGTMNTIKHFKAKDNYNPKRLKIID